MAAANTILLMILVIVGCSRAAVAQGLALECDESIMPTLGNLGYQSRSDDVRCEGAYELPVSATGIELVSATIGSIKFDTTANDYAVIKVPGIESNDAGPVDIRVVGLPFGLYYRLDARANPDSSMLWSLSPVVQPWGLRSADLGAFSTANIDKQKIIIPLTIAPQGEVRQDNTIQLAIRSSVDLESVWWRELKSNGPATAYQVLKDKRVRGGDIVRLDVPGGSPEILHIEFAARLANGGRERRLRLHVYRPS